MTTITTKRHPFKFYVNLAFAALFFLGLGTVLLVLGVENLQSEQPTAQDYFILVTGLAFYLFTFWMIHTYWKNSPIITVDKQSIKIGDETFYLKDIEDIVLTGKMPFKLFTTIPMEGTAILFKDGTEKTLFDDMYSNSSELKLFLEQVVLKKQDFYPNAIDEVSKNTIGFEDEDTFKGNQFTSFRGISLWVIIGFLTFMVFSRWQNLTLGLLISLGAFGVFWFILHSWLMHYFGLTREYLVVRNHNFIWKVSVYRLTDIKEIVFETQEQQPNRMRIITKNFKNKFYLASTLRDKTWLDLKAKLEAKGVAVRNESIFEE